MRLAAVHHALATLRRHGVELTAGRCIDVGGTRRVHLETDRPVPRDRTRWWKDLVLAALGEPIPPPRKEVVIADNPLLAYLPGIEFLDGGFTVADLGTSCDIQGDLLREEDVAPLQGRYQLTLSFDTLEHVPDPFAFCRNLVRITCPGGHVYVSTVFCWEHHPAPADYFRFSPDGLRQCFAGTEAEVLECGWDVPGISVFALVRRPRSAAPEAGSTGGDPRDAFLARVVRGQSFADVGGLWGTVSEKVSVAHQHGARELTMIDIVPPDHELWAAFEDRRHRLGLPEVRCLSGDIIRLANGPEPPVFDVVHCSGVLYHLPNPMAFLAAMRKVTRRHLVLSSSVTATRLENAHGRLEVPRSAALFVPALRGRERDIVRGHWQPLVGQGAIGLTSDLERWHPEDYVPWWWLPTPDALRALCECAGFRCLDEAPYWENHAYTLLLERQD
ncbi:MAG: methyltransferase domain-containing protein [Myxococcales bacterium]|nr:methyltransferase domain-containing protein [Myxococcota bacterium]MDW8283549.1 methyltransferase domain-containing protein [Myxococcales bacterium]